MAHKSSELRTSLNRFANDPVCHRFGYNPYTPHSPPKHTHFSRIYFSAISRASLSVDSLLVDRLRPNEIISCTQLRCTLRNASSDVTSVRYLISSDIEINGHITRDTFGQLVGLLYRCYTYFMFGSTPFIRQRAKTTVVGGVFVCCTALPTIISAGWEHADL